MATPMIKAELRDSVNRKNAGKLRNEREVPGDMYSQGKQTKSIKIDKIELQCLPMYIPQYVQVDVSELKFG